MKAPADFPRLLAMFFSSRLMQQRQASPHTIASYRDTFRLLVHYAQRKLKKPPSELALEDLDSALIGDFLSHLENERGNSARSRNARLARSGPSSATSPCTSRNTRPSHNVFWPCRANAIGARP